MELVCPCIKDPSLHSFRIQSETDTEIIYYCCMSESTDTNVKQIVSHIKWYLEKTDKKWSCIMDSRDFTVKWHTFSLTLELFKLIKEHQSRLREIQMIHMNSWMKDFLQFCIPYMSTELQKALVIK